MKTHLDARLSRARDRVESVLLQSNQDDDKPESQDAGDVFRYSPADEVLRVARAALSHEKILVLPTSAVTEFCGDRVVLTRTFTVVNSQDPDDEDRTVTGVGSATWASGGVGAAMTLSRKAVLLDLLEIPTHSEDRDRERHQAKRKSGRKASPSQIRDFIGRAQREAQLSDQRVLELATQVAGESIGDLRALASEDVEPLVEAIRKVNRGRRK